MSSAALLAHLNLIVGTNHLLSTRGVRDLVEHIRRSSYDLGEAYGKVRHWWHDANLATTGRKHYATLQEDEAAYNSFRRSATCDFSLQTSLLPPRRVWDLHSNRVLPFTVLVTLSSQAEVSLPDNLWTVSHSWVAEEEREEVWTPINRRRWPVSIPRSTTLEHVRIELLNMGAEYVWLDVLCLRQQGRDRDEARRAEEWKTDVPTIGHIYQGQPSRRPCITYFNGLGLPFDTSSSTLASDRHWFNRVWTLQESLRSWLPGGLTGDPIPNGAAFFGRVRTLLELTDTGGLAEELMRRRCTKEVDRISGLAYILGCETLPLYDESFHIEHAWELLVKHMWGDWRADLACCFAADTLFALFPSWQAYALGRRALHLSVDAPLRLDDGAVLHTIDVGRYSHTAQVFGPCKITRPKSTLVGNDLLDGQPDLHLHFDSWVSSGKRGQTLRFIAKSIHGVLLESAEYHIVQVNCSRGDQCWVVVEVVAEWDYYWDREVVGEIEAVKWGVIQVAEKDDGRLKNLIGNKERNVVYIAGEDALRRTRHEKRYLWAFQQMIDSGRTRFLAS
ncbi:hypothetical protein PsYK624_053170 [Phanerochaete sordida]|uniref:Heterokaryon incompatibility domain-containing protein n=1 Tax=Phanerochaete sordida TaxID=48140 RepID=A0A9P3G707_9APHY|nr:hypothetical protein PsYK624_053170 [Phanerochaete sordida]